MTKKHADAVLRGIAQGLKQMGEKPVRGGPSWKSQSTRRLLARTRLGLLGHPYPAANVGRRHPDYGTRPLEHAAIKQARQMGDDR